MENEFGHTLRHMKHSKIPGIDSFSSEFYKIFWKYLKFCVLRALNDSMDRRKLPLSLHQCVITCLHKKGKNSEMIKNSLPLSIICQLASAAIANRLKSYFDNLIHKTQNRFVPGRYIGDCTRMVFDIMNYISPSSKTNII